MVGEWERGECLNSTQEGLSKVATNTQHGQKKLR